MFFLTHKNYFSVMPFVIPFFIVFDTRYSPLNRTDHITPSITSHRKVFLNLKADEFRIKGKKISYANLNKISFCFFICVLFVMKSLTLDICYAKEDIRRCFVGAGKKYEIDPILLYSIARIESNFNSWATNKNKNGSRDIGIMQINSSWLPLLKSNGINEKRLFEPCLNIHMGAFILARAIKDNGNNWRAVGAYNAGSTVGERHERNRIKYAKNIYNYYSTVKLQLSTKQKQFKDKRIANNNG